MAHWAHGPNRDATIARIRESRGPVVVSRETAEKIARANRGRKHSPEWIANARAGRAARSGWDVSDETRQRLRDSHLGKGWTPEQRAAKPPPTPQVKKARNKRDKLLRRYGLTTETYASMLDAQAGVCAICGEPPKGERPLDVDHDHGTGKVRALLCNRCNRTMGHLGDSIALLSKMLDYLVRHEATAFTPGEDQ